MYLHFLNPKRCGHKWSSSFLTVGFVISSQHAFEYLVCWHFVKQLRWKCAFASTWYLFRKLNSWISYLLISMQLVLTLSSGPVGILSVFPGFSFCSFCVSSYLHCEWATEQQLEKDKRIQQKIKRFKMKQAQRALLFADVRQFGCPWTFFIGIFREQLIILYEQVSVFMICGVWGATCGHANMLIFFCESLI